jgi:hypothetical protein
MRAAKSHHAWLGYLYRLEAGRERHADRRPRRVLGRVVAALSACAALVAAAPAAAQPKAPAVSSPRI